jgi:hypothetical protein
MELVDSFMLQSPYSQGMSPWNPLETRLGWQTEVDVEVMKENALNPALKLYPDPKITANYLYWPKAQ